MRILERRVDGVLVLELHGALTAGDSDVSLRRAVRVAADAGASTIVINMEDVHDVDSSGVAELASAHITTANRGGLLRLCALSKKVKHIFKITRLQDVFQIFATEAEAVRDAGEK